MPKLITATCPDCGGNVRCTVYIHVPGKVGEGGMRFVRPNAEGSQGWKACDSCFRIFRIKKPGEKKEPEES